MSFHVSVVIVVVPLCWQHLPKYLLLRQPESGEIKESLNGSCPFTDTVRADYCMVTSTDTSRLAQRNTVVSYTYSLHAAGSSCNPHSSALEHDWP